MTQNNLNYYELAEKLEKCARLGQLEKIKNLEADGVSLHGDNGKALLQSVIHNQIEVCQYILDSSPLISDQNKSFKYACRYGHLTIAKLFVEKGVDIHYDSDACLMETIIYGRTKVFKYLVSLGADIHVSSDCALFIAAKHNRLFIANFLLKQSPTFLDEAIIKASEKDHMNMVDLICSYGGNIDLAKDHGTVDIQRIIHARELSIELNQKDQHNTQLHKPKKNKI